MLVPHERTASTMFNVGQKVVCTNDQFPGPIRKLYQALPVKDSIYTVRKVYHARSVAFPLKPGTADDGIGVLLNELVNPPDPKNKHQRELGFDINRFAPLQEDLDKLSQPEEQVDYVGKELEHV